MTPCPAVATDALHDIVNNFDETHWSQTTWGSTKMTAANPQVLSPHQAFTAPLLWPRLSAGHFSFPPNDKVRIAPRWPAPPATDR